MLRSRIVLVGLAALAAGHLAAVTSANVTIASIPPGLTFTVDGDGCSAGGYSSPRTLAWPAGGTCNVTFTSIQVASPGARYLFGSWLDGPTANPRAIVVPSQPATFTAGFLTQYLVTATANPPEGGTVSGGGWYAAASTATLTATPASGFLFSDWTPGIGPPGVASVPVFVGGPVTVAADFASINSLPPGSYEVNQIALSASAGTVRAINSFGQVAGTSNTSAFLWTPIAANSPAGSLIDLPAPLVSAAVAVNDAGQVAGTFGPANAPPSTAFLWSPTARNGTVGGVTAFLSPQANPTAGPTAIMGFNNYGQAGGLSGGSPFLWTPATPNGTSGATNTDPRLFGIAGINDYGQAVLAAQPPTLFTPSSPQGSSGSFTPIPTLAGALGTQPIAINSGGVVVGSSCVPPGTNGPCSGHAFVWTPATPNGTSGTTSEIAAPSGFAAIAPTAVNTSGQVVGSMSKADFSLVPFLYTGGKVYDLSLLNAQLRGGSAVGINDAGQIVINVASSVYLLTPGATSPAAGSVAVTIAGPPGAPVTVSGNGCAPGTYAAPQAVYWIPGSNCTVTLLSPFSNSVGTRYSFTGWTDGSIANPRTFTAPAQPTTLGAIYATEFELFATANPINGGAVTGTGWYAGGSPVSITASAAAGYRFLDWTPAIAQPGTAQATVIMTGPQIVTANFVALSALPPVTYQITGLSGATQAPKPLNNFGQVVGSNVSNAFLWTPGVANAAMGSVTVIPGMTAATAINDSGQVAGFIGNPVGVQPLLWTPITPNGTFGQEVIILGGPANPPGGAFDINSFGQVSGQIGATAFLWTPAAANGATGSANTDSRLVAPVAINDFGQAITSAGTLFTPSTAHGATGTFTPVFGLPGATSTILRDINASGTIAGSSCIPAGLGPQCNNVAFLWTAGTAAPIPMPPGVVSMLPSALNNRGQVVGSMILSNGLTTPFLYSGGTVYDLSGLSSLFRGGIAVGINDRGQIVINTGYLLTPQSLLAPSPVNVNLNSGSSSGTMTFTFSDPRGWQDLDVVNILINNFLDGRNACYLAYSRPLNVLYLVSDAGGGLLPGLSNSQCAVTMPAPPAGAGNTLTLTLNITFTAGFAGNKVIYMAARDLAQNNSGWQALGTVAVPGGAAPPLAVTGLNPVRGAGLGSTFTFTFNDSKGWQDLGVVNILINDFLDGRNACYLAYSRPLSALFLVNDPGTALQPGLSNSQCSVPPASLSAVSNGNTLTLTLTINFTGSFAGNRVIYAAARDLGDLNTSGWQAVGSWTVQ